MDKYDMIQALGLNMAFQAFERDAQRAALARKQRMWDKFRDEDPNTLPDLALIEAEQRGMSDPED